MTRIVVSADGSGACEATIDDINIVGKQGKKVVWMVENAGCPADENWHIELEFTTEWNNGRDKIVKISRDDIKAVRVHPQATPTGEDGHDYKVYLVYPKFFGQDIRILVIDPELDIEM